MITILIDAFSLEIKLKKFTNHSFICLHQYEPIECLGVTKVCILLY